MAEPPAKLTLDELEVAVHADAKVPMGRFGEAAEMAKAALWLASDDSSYVTGTEFLVDGGITAAYVTAE
jgi:NAD(P)-dependent dehydrogenase (short-subunit alcohol dehydrogenase family)